MRLKRERNFKKKLKNTFKVSSLKRKKKNIYLRKKKKVLMNIIRKNKKEKDNLMN